MENSEILIKVPLDSTDYYINNVGCLRYSQYEGKVSSCVEPEQSGFYLKNTLHIIIGTKTENNNKFVILKEK